MKTMKIIETAEELVDFVVDPHVVGVTGMTFDFQDESVSVNGDGTFSVSDDVTPNCVIVVMAKKLDISLCFAGTISTQPYVPYPTPTDGTGSTHQWPWGYSQYPILPPQPLNPTWRDYEITWCCGNKS